MLFVHLVKLPRTSSLLLRPPVAPTIPSNENETPVSEEVNTEPTLEPKKIASIPFDPSSPYVLDDLLPDSSDDLMALWDEQDDVEFEYARDSYSAIQRLSDLVEMEQLLVPPPRIRARTLSWSPEATPEETASSVAANILRRKSDATISPSEMEFVGVLDSFLETVKRIYDDRILKDVPRSHVEGDLQAMLEAIERIRRISSDESHKSATSLAKKMIHQVIEDVHGLQHFGAQGELEYVKL
ncbi:unnamed protein product [Aphanomyces euteiches]|uniref:Uncharacterized protein n=1 Tax=Aphanomyces euteiches TaxID=100861 RepID=A0A6G0WZJ1_9STRA|nr:hypothetical protein Ae201684_009866 [Aphanomyces euteiches]KAH9095854.1 hypothetical protein Ae201684P_010065 [Aphanomyces euteiches]